MKILYIGDIMGRPGREVVSEVLPSLKKDQGIDVVIAQAENASHGKGITPQHMNDMQNVGVDFFTGGNHSMTREQSYDLLDDESAPIIRPANLSKDLPGRGWGEIKTDAGAVLVISVLGSIFPASMEIDSPIHVVDAILSKQSQNNYAATIINMHGEYTSEKKMMGHYYDGKVTAVIGDHTHVQTNDDMILPKGTAYITDVGMCGTIYSSIGLTFDSMLPMFKDGQRQKMEIDRNRPFQFNAILIDTEKQDIQTINKQIK